MSFAFGELITSVEDSIILFIPQINETIIDSPVIRMDHTFNDTLPRITFASVTLVQSGTISVSTLPPFSRIPNTGIFHEA